MARLLIIIPAFNEEKNIDRVIERVRNVGPQLPAGVSMDIAVINDGSKDRTKEVAEKTGAMVLDLPFNVGIGATVQTGFKYAAENHYDMAVQVDGDGQHDPQFLPALIEPVLNGNADMVIGSRFIDNQGFQSTFIRRLGIRIFYAVNSLIIRQKITDNTSGFRAYSAKAIQLLADEYPSDYPEPESVIILGLRKFRILEIPVVMKEREGGRSSITLFRSLYYMIKVLLAIFINIFKKQ
ncbi:glycosyltransferase family 2 protein [bacterium]|nr:glycosyltransferase family 2 protein [bacterium]